MKQFYINYQTNCYGTVLRVLWPNDKHSIAALIAVNTWMNDRKCSGVATQLTLLKRPR